jgi:hypothetical protein
MASATIIPFGASSQAPNSGAGAIIAAAPLSIHIGGALLIREATDDAGAGVISPPPVSARIHDFWSPWTVRREVLP